MIIYSFDCAVKNFGVCCLEVDEHWRKKAAILINKLSNFYENIPSRSEFYIKIKVILQEIIDLQNGIFKIKFLNIIDLVPEGKVTLKTSKDILRRLKYMLYCLDSQLPKPDVVLIEHQMVQNDKARAISRYIESHYSPKVDHTDLDDTITFAMPAYPLIAAEIPDDEIKKQQIVHVISATLKNSYDIDQETEAGLYSTYIEKYSNYTANKKHSTHNFKYFMEKTNRTDQITDIPNKLDDIADAFMMAYAWCKRTELI